MRAEADMLRGQCGDLLAAAPGKTPLSATLRRVRALCAIDGGDTGAAEKEVAAGLTDHPGDAGLQPVAARLAIVRGDLPDAERPTATALQAGGDGVEIQKVAGRRRRRPNGKEGRG